MSELFSGVKRFPATPALPGLSGPFETHPGEIIRNHRPGMLTVNGAREGSSLTATYQYCSWRCPYG